MVGFSSQFGLFIPLVFPAHTFQNVAVIINGNCGRADGKVTCHWNFKGAQHSSHPVEWESNEPSGKVLGVGVEWGCYSSKLSQAKLSGVSDSQIFDSACLAATKCQFLFSFGLRLPQSRALVNPCLHWVTGLHFFFFKNWQNHHHHNHSQSRVYIHEAKSSTWEVEAGICLI